MAKILQFLFFVFASLSLCVTSNQVAEPYVIYMGSTLQDGDHEALQAAHLQMLSSVIPSEEKERVSLMQSYHHTFKGFSAMLTEKEAALLSAGYDEVVSVFRDQMLQLHTTRSWDFLDAESGIGPRLRHKASNDIIIGIIDTESYPLVFGRDVAAESTPVSEASNCYPGSIDTDKVAGKIIVCVNTDPTVTRRIKKLVAEGSRAKGLILIDDVEKEVPFDSGIFPFSQVGNEVGAQIFKYINSTKKPTAVILPSEDIKEFKPAPIVAYFSARGPGGLTEGILKPDLMAPGVSILAAAIPSSDIGTVPAGKKPSNFAVKSGTSMACPHVAGAGAFVKTSHPRWSPSMIRSAFMTTAITTNNLGKPLTSNSGATASFHEMGAGEISPLRALSPGLVFETTAEDYLHFLCHYGYKNQAIRSISGTNFSCPSNSSPDLISSINYPSISIAKLESKQTMRAISRTVTNVGPPNSTYTATMDAPNGIKVKVSPERLTFTRRWMKASYQISFDAKSASKGYGYGSLTWSDGAHTVRTVFAVNVV
ncbi:CO(2)-response secreted protease-like isoform X2 [Canna indica]|uniref:CO(2)-response secreted protease-like isoform X2 n=1 Tax=Canna indica TaxID=4628 RepID=A0AAQ3JTA7_9LILI|nr:CO(2)-response secreted protease-like isoform X2 [Canna indica]